MDVVMIFNGLGNQMSQYAFYLSKRQQTKKCVAFYNNRFQDCHNGYELGRVFGINFAKGIKHDCLQFLYRLADTNKLGNNFDVIIKKALKKIEEAKNYDFNPELLKPSSTKGINFYVGGWHSEKNFISVKDEVKAVFQFPPINNPQCEAVVQKINEIENSVSVHIRRGDYLISNQGFYQFNGVTTLLYYKEAMRKIESEFPDCVFFVFSDDLEWCKAQLNAPNIFFIDCNSGMDSWRDMYLMSICKHHINANSTFSWWGAWLAKKDGITICPKEFIRNVRTKDIYPDQWIKM